MNTIFVAYKYLPVKVTIEKIWVGFIDLLGYTFVKTKSFYGGFTFTFHSGAVFVQVLKMNSFLENKPDPQLH